MSEIMNSYLNYFSNPDYRLSTAQSLLLFVIKTAFGALLKIPPHDDVIAAGMLTSLLRRVISIYFFINYYAMCASYLASADIINSYRSCKSYKLTINV